MADRDKKDPRDKWIPYYFVAFFAVVAFLDSIFVYTAITTQTGVVTENPYEKGLDYNTVIEEAKAQPSIENTVTYEDGKLKWSLPMEDAVASAFIVRPIQDGHDFEIALQHTGNGIYEADPEIPFKGLWTARLSAKWDKNKQFRATHDFIVK